MGSDLANSKDKAATFIIHAIKEVNGANLDRAQIIKGWVDADGKTHEKIYYVRIIEIPTPRWSTYDAVVLRIPARTDIPATIQERGWSSPIWYSPK